jgi:glycosyltransferase involved in cell wall biosynthesis
METPVPRPHQDTAIPHIFPEPPSEDSWIAMGLEQRQPLRIAFIGLRSIGICSGGIERHVEELAVRMADLGHEVTVYCRGRYNALDNDRYKGVRLINRPAVYTKHLEAITHTAAAISMMSPRYDIVHIHATGPSLLSWAPRLLGHKVVVTVHGLDFLRAKWGNVASAILKLGAWTAVACPHRTIVVSRMLKDYYRKAFGRGTEYIPNGVAPAAPRELNGLRRFGIERKRYILSLGRLVREKGVHYLIEAFRRTDTDLKLVIAGDAHHNDGYERLLREMAAGDDRIVFTGPLYDDDKDEAFANAKLFVLPSDLEGMPIVLLEAMGHGCPVLSSDIPECTEVFTPAGESFGTWPLCATFRASDPMSLRQELERALADPCLGEMGLMAKQYATSEFNWDRIARQTIGVYRSMIQPRALPALDGSREAA